MFSLTWSLFLSVWSVCVHTSMSFFPMNHLGVNCRHLFTLSLKYLSICLRRIGILSFIATYHYILMKININSISCGTYIVHIYSCFHFMSWSRTQSSPIHGIWWLHLWKMFKPQRASCISWHTPGLTDDFSGEPWNVFVCLLVERLWIMGPKLKS